MKYSFEIDGPVECSIPSRNGDTKSGKKKKKNEFSSLTLWPFKFVTNETYAHTQSESGKERKAEKKSYKIAPQRRSQKEINGEGERVAII